ncbi:MAG: 50S ribosomal protein L3 N(5)-glutamine methyltransferase [Betaproteobacteria bacterium]
MQARARLQLKWLCHAERHLHDALRVACSVFESEGLAYGQGTECAFEDAAWLLLWSLDLPRDRLDDFRESQLSRAELRRFAGLLRKRVESRTPVAYLTSEAWLQGLCFHADPRALIPRSLLVEALAWCAEQGLVHAPTRILDLCTGSASVLVHAGLRFPQASLFGSDLSEPALSLAAENLNAHGIAARCDLRLGSGLSPWAGKRFDLLLCNPPYVKDAAMERLPPEFLAEPRIALSGGSDGMHLIRPWLAEVAHFLDPDGAMLLEIGRGAEDFEAAFPGLDPVWVPVAAGPRMVAFLQQSQLLAYFLAEQPLQGGEQLGTS